MKQVRRWSGASQGWGWKGLAECGYNQDTLLTYVNKIINKKYSINKKKTIS